MCAIRSLLMITPTETETENGLPAELQMSPWWEDPLFALTSLSKEALLCFLFSPLLFFRGTRARKAEKWPGFMIQSGRKKGKEEEEEEPNAEKGEIIACYSYDCAFIPTVRIASHTHTYHTLSHAAIIKTKGSNYNAVPQIEPFNVALYDLVWFLCHCKAKRKGFVFFQWYWQNNKEREAQVGSG